MITGAIDNVTMLPDGRVRLGGWAAIDESGVKRPVEAFALHGLQVHHEFTRSFRKDFGEPGEFGFYLLLPNAESLALLYYGAVRCHASADTHSKQIEIWSRIRSKIFSVLLAHESKNIEPTDASELVNAILKLERAEQTRPKHPVYEPMMLEVGAASIDRNVIIGRQGCLFLYRGTNALHDQYVNPANPKLLRSWIDRIAARAHLCADRGIAFLQMIIPEKQSILHDLYPIPITSPTPMLRGIGDAFKTQSYYLDCYALLRNLYEHDGLIPFRKIDSHLSLFGAAALAREISERHGLRLDLAPASLRETVLTGDLGSKMLDGEVAETCLMTVFDDWPLGQKHPELVESRDPPEGHFGVYRQWTCAGALIDKHVVIFGNSVFERGGAPLGLSWWLARIFRKTTFIWSPTVDWDRVDRMKPDLVICQTVERFLTVSPET